MIVKTLRNLSLVCALASAGAAQAEQPLEPVPPPREATVDVDPALWVVRDDDTTIYLFGTIHILKPGLSWFDEGVKTAFDSSDELVMELVEPSAAESQQIFARYGLDSKGKVLTSKLSAAERTEYETVMQKFSLPVAAMEPLDPWAVAVTLQLLGLQKTGFDVNSGVEIQLTAAAKAAHKPIGGVETMDSQLAIFDGLPEKNQVRFLMDSVRTIDDIGAGMDDLVDTWSKPDPEALAKLMNDGLADPVLYSRLLTQRNANWAHWIDKRMQKPGTIFMAVGAGHLAGQVSVQNLLRAYGRESQRVIY